MANSTKPVNLTIQSHLEAAGVSRRDFLRALGSAAASSALLALLAPLATTATRMAQAAEQPVDGVAEVFELVTGSLEGEAFVEGTFGDPPGGRRHRAQRAQNPARDQPAECDRDRGHDRQRDPGLDEPLVETMGVAWNRRGVLLLHLADSVRSRVRAVGDDQIYPGGAAEE